MGFETLLRIDDSPMCSEYARALDVSPAGTALALDRLVLVSVPLPWPKPALGHWLVKPAVNSVTKSPVASRLLLCEPTGPADQRVVVEVVERNGHSASFFRWSLAVGTDDRAGFDDPQSRDSSATLVAELVAQIGAAGPGRLGDVAVAGTTAQDVSGELETGLVVICVQGTHDVCCGKFGVGLADEILEKRPTVTLRRVSHTGGHRFAPTLWTFPDGRMWAFADLGLVERALAETATATDLARRCRGWWGLGAGAAQVAEIAVRAADAGSVSGPLSISQKQAEPAESISARAASESVATTFWSVASETEEWSVSVFVARTVAAVTCQADGGHPAKAAVEYSYEVEPLAANERVRQ